MTGGRSNRFENDVIYNAVTANFFLLKHNNEFNFKVIKYFILLRFIPESKSQRGENNFVSSACFALLDCQISLVALTVQCRAWHLRFQFCYS